MIQKFLPKFWPARIFLLLLLLWWGVPTFNKWRADRLVDELCAKDGGVRVYETVSLTANQFNQWGQFAVPAMRDQQPGVDFYRVAKNLNIKGNVGSSDIFALAVYQTHFWIYRASDKKILGESIAYARRGGIHLVFFTPLGIVVQNLLLTQS